MRESTTKNVRRRLEDRRTGSRTARQEEDDVIVDEDGTRWVSINDM